MSLRPKFKAATTLTMLLVAVAAGCSRVRDVSGQIFVVTKDRTNVKMGMVGVHVATDEQMRAIGARLVKEYDIAIAKYKRHSAQGAKDQLCLEQLRKELSAMIPKQVPVKAIDDLDEETVDRIRAIQDADRPELIDPLLTNGALADRLIAALPPPSAKTDADGRFTVSAGPGDWVLARDQRSLIGDVKETYLWIDIVPKTRAPLLIANDSLVTDDALLRLLRKDSHIEVATQEAVPAEVSAVVQNWCNDAEARARAARAQAIAAYLATAKEKYKLTRESISPEILNRWGGEAWRKLQIDVATIDPNDDEIAAAALYHDAADKLDGIIATAQQRETQWQSDERIAALKEKARAEAAARAATAEAEQRRIAQERAAQHEAELQAEKAKQNAEKAKREADLEKLRNTPLYDQTTSVVTSGFTSFEFGFGFWAHGTISGSKLDIFLNGKEPKSEIFGGGADASLNIDNRRKGAEEYSSNGHDFLIEWDKPSRLGWSVKITVRRLD